MDADLIKSILAVIAAFIPLLVTIIAFLASRPARTVLTIDRPSLKMLEIKRYPRNYTDGVAKAAKLGA